MLLQTNVVNLGALVWKMLYFYFFLVVNIFAPPVNSNARPFIWFWRRAWGESALGGGMGQLHWIGLHLHWGHGSIEWEASALGRSSIKLGHLHMGTAALNGGHLHLGHT